MKTMKYESAAGGASVIDWLHATKDLNVGAYIETPWSVTALTQEIEFQAPAISPEEVHE